MKRPCIDCGRPTVGSRCPPHAAAVARRREQQRGTREERGYDHRWRTVRRLVLRRDGYRCVWCGELATTVDHLQPLAHGGDRLDPANLGACCKPCNDSRGGATRRPSHAV